jgi:hypothetical protein
MDLFINALSYGLQMFEVGEAIGNAAADGEIDLSEGVSMLPAAIQAAVAGQTLNSSLDAASHASEAKFSTVEWCSSSLNGTIGKARLPDDGLEKCNPQDFLVPTDIVKANADLHSLSMKKVAKGTLGTLKSNEGGGMWVVEWVDIGELHTSQTSFKKCTASEYILISDVVKANCDLTWSSLGKSVAKGTIGTLKSTEGNLWLVLWSEGIGELYASKDQFTKCNLQDFLIPTDIVKANTDLYLSSVKKVAKGTLGTLTSNEGAGMWVVEWGDIGKLHTNQTSFKKCKPSEYWQKGDILETTHDFTFNNDSITVLRGTLCQYMEAA